MNNLNVSQKISHFINTHEYKELKVSNTLFRYLLCGEGKRTLIFLDGGMGTSEAWFEYINFFEEKFQILTFPFPDNLPTNIKQVIAIKELMDKLCIHKATFIGISYGSLLAQLFTKNFPEYVDDLVLISGAGLTSETKLSLKKYKFLFKLSILSAKILPFKLVRKMIIKKSIKNLTNRNETKQKKSLIETSINKLYKDCSKETVMNMGYLLLNLFDSENCQSTDFDFLDNKTLLIFPENDFFPKETQIALLNLMKNPEVIWIDSGAHGDPLFDDNYLKIIEAFLNKG